MTTIVFPASYDAKASHWDDPQDRIVLTLVSDLAPGATSVTFNETSLVASLAIPGYLTFREEVAGDWEIVKYTARPGAGQLTIQRGALGSTDMAHAAVTDQAVQDPVSEHWALLRAVLLAVQKYQGLVGLASAKPATCSAGECYVATDTGEVFYAIATDTWLLINRQDHGAFGSLGADDHAPYHNDARKGTWHTGLAGEHITDVDHDHSDAGIGAPIARFLQGSLANLPADPQALGQLYFASDTGDLYLGAGAPLDWAKYSVMPAGAIVVFDATCPLGWTYLSAVEDKFLRGAPTDVWSGLTDGGGTQHTHRLDQVITHVHAVDAIAGIGLAAEGGHSHTFDERAGSGTNTYTYGGYANTGYISTSTDGGHSHSVNFPQRYTVVEGTGGAQTDGDPALPPYVKYVFCTKD